MKKFRTKKIRIKIQATDIVAVIGTQIWKRWDFSIETIFFYSSSSECLLFSAMFVRKIELEKVQYSNSKVELKQKRAKMTEN